MTLESSITAQIEEGDLYEITARNIANSSDLLKLLQAGDFTISLRITKEEFRDMPPRVREKIQHIDEKTMEEIVITHQISPANPSMTTCGIAAKGQKTTENISNADCSGCEDYFENNKEFLLKRQKEREDHVNMLKAEEAKALSKQ